MRIIPLHCGIIGPPDHLSTRGTVCLRLLEEALQREVRLEDIHSHGEIIVRALPLARHEKDLPDYLSGRSIPWGRIGWLLDFLLQP